MIKKCDFPEFIIAKWQNFIDLLSSTFSLPATLITQLDGSYTSVFAKCSTKENPYVIGKSDKMLGLYCEAVINSKNKLLVTNARADEEWTISPNLKSGMIAYLGYPLQSPSGEVFGTICVLDNKENPFGEPIEQFLLQLKEIIELDIFTYYSYEKASEEIENCMLQQFKKVALNHQLQSGFDDYKPIYESLGQRLNQFKNKLLKQDNKYDILFKSMNDALVVFEPILNSEGDVVNARYIDMNASNEKIIGYKKNEVIGRCVLDIFPNTEKYWFRSFDSVVKSRKSHQFVSYYEEFGKSFSLNVFPLDEKTFVMSCHDVSDQEILKKKLEESERRYKTIFHESSSIMLLIDPENGDIIDANSTAVKFYGFHKKELCMMNLHDINIMSTEDIQKEIDLVAQNKKTHFLFKHRIASGEIRDVEVYSGTINTNGHPVLHSVIHDVTESVAAIEKVRRLSMAVEQSPVAIVMTDIKGNIVYCNPRHCELTGYSNEEMIGNNPRILKSGKFSKEVYVDLWKTISAGNKWKGELFNKKKDGSFYWEFETITPIKSKNGEIVNYLKYGEDISDRKRLENQLSQSILKAEESDKLKSSFLANLSHEVRTPLNGIMGFTNLMISDDISDDERKEYASFVESSGHQLMATMDNILKLSMIEVGEMSVKYSNFDVSILISEVDTYYSSEVHDKGLELKIDCKCNSLIRNDRKRIRQVLDCLIQNAIKFTDQGQITIKGEASYNMLILSVEDTGIGINSKDHNAIFDRFRQVDGCSSRKFDGSGLGLAISKEIVLLLGGEIWLESEIGKGSKFIFTIPNIPEDDK